VLLLALAAPLLVSPPPGAAATAVIEGVVTLPPAGSVPVPKPRYPGGTAYEAGTPDAPAAIVYLEGSFPDGAGGSAAVAEVAQARYQFAPGFLAVRRGGVVRFPNHDDEYHSVFSYSKTKRFDLGRYHKDETPAEITFEQVGVVKLFCEIHDHMRGTILVLDTPYFRKTDAAGRYRLAGLPPGRWVVKAWIDEGDVREQAIELRDGQTLRVDFPGG
jgi:plastocyanin